MPILLDDQPLDAAGPTLGAILEQAQKGLAEGGRIVVEVVVAGESLAGEALDARLDEDVSAADIKLVSAQPAELATEALTGVRDQLGEARLLQAEAADLLQRDRISDGLEKVTQAINAWLNTQQAVLQSATVLNVDLDSFEVDGNELTDSVHELVDQLKELRDMITAGDMVGLADTLAYEWPDITDRWDAFLGALLDQAKN